MQRSPHLIARDVVAAACRIEHLGSDRRPDDWISRLAVRLSVRHVSGGAPPADRVPVLCVARNAEYYLENFIRHYQDLGNTHVVLLDNGSSDHSVEIASGFEGVTVLSSALPFRTYAWAFRSYLLNTYGASRWTLIADVDEFLALPAPLDDFLAEADAEGAEVVNAHMLDMFPRGDFRTVTPKQMVERCIYYELDSVEKTDGRWRKGVRFRVFGVDAVLTKPALLKVAHSDGFRSHRSGRKPSRRCGVFRHYKFTPALIAIYQDALTRLQYWKDSRQYRSYPQRLTEISHDLYSPKALRWTRDFPDLP